MKLIYNTFYLSHYHELLFYISFEVLTVVTVKSTISWDITLCSPFKVKTFQRKMLPPSSGLCLSPAFTLESCSAYSLTLRMEVVCSSETV
jgi:hypothetical protein